jgi:hypothetical protein
VRLAALPFQSPDIRAEPVPTRKYAKLPSRVSLAPPPADKPNRYSVLDAAPRRDEVPHKPEKRRISAVTTSVKKMRELLVNLIAGCYHSEAAPAKKARMEFAGSDRVPMFGDLVDHHFAVLQIAMNKLGERYDTERSKAREVGLAFINADRSDACAVQAWPCLTRSDAPRRHAAELCRSHQRRRGPKSASGQAATRTRQTLRGQAARPLQAGEAVERLLEGFRATETG